MLDCSRIEHLFNGPVEKAGHVGTHYGAMKNFFQSHLNMQVLNTMLAQIAVWLETTPGLARDDIDLTLGFLCTQGKHRSRLMAWLLREASAMSSGMLSGVILFVFLNGRPPTGGG